ncbi:hypothetical protein EC919_101313 [Pseudomonas graminis]|uniref:hypothetical protein n=1 Tax=Pseudomonas graminis TaxID=158627 RepID=UPI001062236B|nr:hypothetical protein [Pseudomonas graminis]TDV58267.1 hypothetical protein EC919_101313 [Pseudomonas graminis]
MKYPTTPDGRYFVVKGQLWRCSNPALGVEQRQEWVNALMKARQAVKFAKRTEDVGALKSARASVNEAKIALGERGPVWWSDGAADFNRHKAVNTPYREWFESLQA